MARTKNAAKASKTVASAPIVKLDNGIVWTFVLDKKSTTDDETLFVAFLEKFVARINDNKYAEALIDLTKINGRASWTIAPQFVDGTDKNGAAIKRIRRATAGLMNAAKNLAYLGRIAPMQFAAVTLPDSKVNGETVKGGTKLYKRS